MAPSMTIGLSLSRMGSTSIAPATTNDPIALTVLNGTSPVTSPTNNIDGSGWVAAVTFKGMATGQTLTPSKVSFTVSEPAFDSSGNATTVSRTITGTKALRMPLYGNLWATGTTYTAGTGWANHIYTKTGGSNTTRIYRCTAAGGGTSTVQPTHTSGSVTGADNYTWLHVSNTTATDSPPSYPIEVVSGSDAVVYVTLDQAVSSGATITGYNIQAGAYGSSNASRATIVTTTNSSTFTPYKPHVAWTMLPWQVVGNTLHCELYADHPFGQSGRTAACVKFTVYDNSNVSTGLTATVTSMVQSTTGTTTNGNPLPVFAADIDVSSLTNGSAYSVRAQVYPFIGAVWDSDTDGFGSTGTWTISTKMPGNEAKRIPFIKDSSAYTTTYAFVDGVGAAPATSTVLATARGTPYASVSAALTALQTANGGTLNYKTICYISDGVTLTGFGGDLASRTYSTTWCLIARDPGGVATTTISADTVTLANRRAGGRIKFEDLSLTFSGTTSVIDNQAASTVGDFQYETWFNRCRLTGASGGATQPITRMGAFWITNSVLTSTGASSNMWGSTRSAWKLSLCNTITGSGTDAPVMNAVHHIGDKCQSKANPSSAITTTNWNDNSAQLDQQIFAFCTWYNCTQNVTAVLVALTSGASWTNNLIEANAAGAKGGQISADAVTTVPGRIYNLFNTAAGDGQNFCYNESGTSQVKKIGISRFNAFPDRNDKADWYDTTSGASPNRTGNFFCRYTVDWYKNRVYNVTFATAGPSNLAGDVYETGASIVNGGTSGFTTDNSKLGAGTGNGDYRPTTSSGFKSMVGAAEQMFPFDLNGTTRKTDGTGACGAFEWA